MTESIIIHSEEEKKKFINSMRSIINIGAIEENKELIDKIPCKLSDVKKIYCYKIKGQVKWIVTDKNNLDYNIEL